LPSSIVEFLEIFQFCFKNKYNYNNIFTIVLEELCGPKRNRPLEEYRAILTNNFYQNLIEKRILDLVFSNNKVILIIDFKEWGMVPESCEKIIDDVMHSFDE
jgi:hypothetical protein